LSIDDAMKSGLFASLFKLAFCRGKWKDCQVFVTKWLTSVGEHHEQVKKERRERCRSLCMYVLLCLFAVLSLGRKPVLSQVAQHEP
jgi:hypothetical protein